MGVHLRIKNGFERCDAQTAEGFNKRFFAVGPQIKVANDQAFNCGDDIIRAKTRTRALPNGGSFSVIAPESDLIAFDACAVQSQDTNVAYMVVATGIDAAADFDL
jgi:hypothetical protein